MSNISESEERQNYEGVCDKQLRIRLLIFQIKIRKLI